MGNWGQVARQAAIQKVNEAASTIKRFTGNTARWRKLCLKRDKYQCLLCGSKQRLEVHHIERWYDAPHKRLKVDNGATLCHACHHEHHKYRGEQFPSDITATLRLRILGYSNVSIGSKEGFVLFKKNRCLTMPELGD